MLNDYERVFNLRLTKFVTRTERGWAGHFCCSHDCLFRRNTLLECGEIKIVVSTVGLYAIDIGNIDNADKHDKEVFRILGWERYYETMAFHSDSGDTRYYDADVGREINFSSPWGINEINADDKANDMHETVVKEITKGLESGLEYGNK